MLFILNATEGKASDLQRLIFYDYLLVHSGDVVDGPASLHPSVPFRGTELIVKRDLLLAGLNCMFARELIDKSFDDSGILYRANALTTAFVGLLRTDYADSLRARSAWVMQQFGAFNDRDLSIFMTANIGQWGAEFEQISALAELEL